MKNSLLSNKFLILIEIAREQPRARQVDIAEKLELTPQAISDHIKELKEKGYIEKRSRKLKVTKKGVQLIINSIDRLEDLISDVKTNVLDEAPCKAIATEDVSEREKVNLFMKKGVLRVSQYDSSNQAVGLATETAVENEELEVKDVSGIIDLKKGSAKILVVPPPEKGGSSSIRDVVLKEHDYDQLFTIGTGAIAFAKKKSIEPNFLYAEPHSTIDTLLKGINCLIIIDKEREQELIEKLEEENIKYAYL
ncbi:hypothetical protein C9439_01720 [archaeon SCG-AAA382B04]|nr:hypothetical protein C9439_01720 [archaeon SCG-AAA382B04]